MEDESKELRQLLQKALKKITEINDYCQLILSDHEATEKEKNICKMIMEYCLEAQP